MTLRLHITPHLVNIPMTRCFLFLLMLCFPGSDFEVAQHIHIVDLMHLPPVFQKTVVSGIDKLWQRQG